MFYEYTRKAVQTQLKPYTLISNLFERLDEIKKLLTRSYYFSCWKATSEGMDSIVYFYVSQYFHQIRMREYFNLFNLGQVEYEMTKSG